MWVVGGGRKEDKGRNESLARHFGGASTDPPSLVLRDDDSLSLPARTMESAFVAIVSRKAKGGERPCFLFAQPFPPTLRSLSDEQERRKA